MQKHYLLFIFFFVSVSASAFSMSPGLWTSTVAFELNGISLPHKKSQACISAEQAKNPKSTISQGLKKQGCELKKWNLKGIHLSAEVICKNEKMEAQGKLKGTITTNSYNIKGNAQGTYKSTIPSVATIKLSGNLVNKKCN